MKIRQILFSALCSLLAVSCVEDVTEDVYIGPEGQTYFTLSFGAESTAVGTKVGFDPSVASPIYWTSTEDITLYDKSNTYKKYGDVIYTAPESGSSTASFEVSSFEVASGTKEISILATSGEVVPQNDGESIYYVTSETLILEHDGSDYNFDSYAGSLPFISPIERAAVTTTTSGVTSYDDDAPVLTMVPLFRAMVLDFCNLDNSYEDAEVGYIMASITLEDGEIYFYDKIAINAENFLYSAEGDNAINTAVKAAETDNDSTFETASITSRVKYKSPVSLADIKDLELPIVSLGTTADDMTGKEFTVAVMFYDSYDETDGILNSTLLAQYEERYTATSDFLYGKMDEIELKAENFAYDLNKAPSVTDVEAEAQGVVAPEIKVTWEYPAEIANAAGVEIAGVKIYYGTTADCEETPIDIAYDEQNLTKEYTLGVSETLGWATDYYIYVATYTDGYAEETPSSTVTATTVEQVDIVLDGDIYKIYTAKGLAAFSNLVNKNVTNDVVGLVTATSDGSDFTTFGESNSNINGQVMTTIDMTTYPDFEGITYYSGTFDGGNGLSEGSATNITIKNLTPENGNGLFNILSDGATIKNVTLTDIVATSSNAANIGAIASAIFFDATVDISYCEVSGSVSGEGDGTGGLVGCAFSDATLSDATLIIGNSTNNATVTINNVDYNSTRGLVGFVNDGVTITFTDCEDTVAGEYVSTAMESTTVGVAVNSSYDGIDIKWTAVAEGETGADDVVAVYYSVADENNYTMAPLTKLSAGIVSLAVGEELTADETYDIYVETKNYLWQSAVATNGGTSSDPVVVKVSSPAYDIVLNNGTYEIYTAEGLMAFAGIVNGGNGGTKPSDIKDNSSITWSNTANASANAKIVADIDMSGKEWTPIGSYAGTFDGGSESFFEIQNLEGANGLFSSTKVSSSASISNVILVDPIIECTTSFVSIGAIVGTLESSTSITNCVVKGGSVEASYSTCIVGALVGENLGSISSSSSSCSVTVEGNLYNGGTDSCLVGAGNGSVSADCYDNYTESEAAKAAEEATIASAIPMYTSTGSVSTVVVTLSFEDGEESVDAKKVYYSGTSNGSAKVGDENTVTLTLTADQTYTIYAVTTNYLEAETKSDEITVTTYGANTYSGVSLPAITATANTNANVITLSWELPTEGLSAELQELVVTYGSYAAETINRATLELGSTTMAATYVSGSGSGQTISYTGGYAPTSASSETIKVTGGSATISEVTADIELVGGVYQIYTVAGLLDFATIVNGVEGDEVTSQTNNSTIATRATAVPANPSANAKIMAPITFSYDNDNSEDDDAKWVSMVDYTGTFDGNTQEIKNLTGTNGLFASAIGATIKNVKLTSIDVVGTTGNIGGLIGSATGATISDCEVSGNVYGNGGGIGGLIGTGSGVITITDTTNSTIVNGDGSASNLGGLIGATTSNSTDVLVITDCRNTATIGNSANRSTVGGLGGYIPMAEGSKITRFTNTGAISGSANVGGVIGNIRTSAAVIDACENSGDVTSTGTCAGGIVGGYHNSGIYTITDTSNSGNISGTTTVGGIVGKAQIATITSSNGYTYNTGSVIIIKSVLRHILREESCTTLAKYIVLLCSKCGSCLS